MTVSAETAAIVLCGGRTTRFGGDKAQALVGGRRVIDRVVDVVGSLCGRVIVVTSAEQAGPALPAGVEVAADLYPGAGPLGGICTGLLACASPLALVVGCDMPFLHAGVMRLLLDRAEGHDAVVPRHGDGYLEPLHAVYARTCLAPMEEYLAAGRLALWEVLGRVRTRYVEEAEYRPLDPAGLSFFNLNSPADLETAEQIAARLPANRPRHRLPSLSPCSPLRGECRASPASEARGVPGQPPTDSPSSQHPLRRLEDSAPPPP